ncbi:pilus assembly protein [Ralstonia syzygii]|uniref:pilus assembly protein n=1 Tax=Ralstonia syzygii TaxID=28097 RepID=UPI0018D17B1D|nr:pilus assembly protein [Ralstonia syzygii]
MRLSARTVLGAMAPVLAVLALASPAAAEDIDLYTGLTPQSGKPNVLILMDNAAAWDASASFTCAISGVVGSNNVGKDVGAEQCALYSAVSSFKNNASLLGNLNLGLMMFGTGSNVGGQFRIPSAAPYALQLMDTNGINNFLSGVQTLDRLADKANGSQVGGGMHEAWAFFAGKTGLSGTQYASPITNPCQRNYVIYIANAVKNGKPQDTGQNAFNAVVAAGATTAQQQQITIPTNSKYQANWGDEWARFMYQTDLSGSSSSNSQPQNIITYTISVTDGNNPDYVAFDNSMATNGGGKTYVVQLGDVDGLKNALLEIFNEVQAVNSVFASVSLPAAVNAQGQFLKQVYIGMFRPDRTAPPRWMGNLKQYQLGYDSTGTVVMQDSLGKTALSSAGTGFLSPSAVSFWTAEPPLSYGTSGYGSSSVSQWPANGFWINSPSGAGWGLDSSDGEVVEKGGAGEMWRAQYLTDQSSRVLYTCNGTGKCPTSGAMPLFNTANTWLAGSSGLTAINSGTSGAATISSSEQGNLINWVRGRDVYAMDGSTVAGQEAETGPGSPVTIRPSVHGDVLHSRPVVVNYGGTTGVVVFYGANDGVFHAINGNQTAGINGVRPGGELWGFIPPEFLGKLSRLYTNAPEIKLSTTPSGITPTPTPRDYFFDGSTTVMQDQRNASSPRTVIYLTARRGGSLIYAIEVTDPLNPRFLWSRSNSDIPEMGQTWSKPRLMRVQGYSNPVLIMGAGYDTAEDSDPSPGVDSAERGVIVLDAYTGVPVWSALANCTGVAGVCVKVTGLTRSIASDVAVVDRSSTGYIQMAYVGDVGGNLWRVDCQGSAGNAPANWTMTQLATLGGAASTNNARKFFYAPDIVPTSGYNAIMAGTGDREHPLYSASTTAGTAYNVVNRFYMIKDPNTGTMPSSWTPITEANLVDLSSTAKTYDGTGSGYYITLPNPGEKVVNAPLTVAGYTYFGTNTPAVPQSGMCYPNLGIARDYALGFLTSTGQNANRSVQLDGGGFPPSPVYGLVSVANGNGTTSLLPILFGGGNQTGSGGGSALQAHQVVITGAGKRKRTYWYSETDKH